MSEEPLDEIVRLATAPNPPVASIWSEALKEEGIRCKVVGDYLEAGIGNISGMLPEIWVHKEDAERAQGIISRLEKENAEESDDDEDE
jgi:hypothetical protein